MKSFWLTLIFCLAMAPAFAADLTFQDLLRRPELRPAQCSIKETASFQSGVTLKAGQKFDILELNPNEVVLTLRNNNFSFTPNQTDIVEVANANYAKLTPKQRALTYAEVIKRQDLWSYRLKLKDTFDIGRERLKKGDTVYLMDVNKKGELVVVPANFSLHFELKPQDTDILEQARVHVENPNGAPGILAEELQGKLIDAATGQPVNLDMNKLPKYFVLYDAARWCPYSQAFTPKFLKAYKEMKAKGADFEVFYIPSDHSALEMQTYAKELNFPWPAMNFSKKSQMAVLAKILGRSSTPEIEVVDRYGNIIIDNNAMDREAVLKQLTALLNKS